MAEENVAPGQFGIWGKENRRDWPPITEDEVRSALVSFGIAPDGIGIGWHSARPFSAVARLDGRDGVVRFLKRHHKALRSRHVLDSEHGFMAHLACNGLPVALPLPMRNGGTVLVQDEWCYELFDGLEGEDLYRETMSWEPYRSVAHATEAGRALAIFHAASAGWTAPSRADQPLVSALSPFLDPLGPVAGLSEWICRQESLHTALDRNGGLARLLGDLCPLLERAAPFLALSSPHWGHGDWHGSNLVWRRGCQGDHVVAPFDFSMADCTSRHFDIAVALERSMIDWLHPMRPEAMAQGGQDGADTLIRPPDRAEDLAGPSAIPDYTVQHEHIAAFLQGYGRVHALGKCDYEMIAAVLPLAHIVFACSEIWYYDVLLGAPDLARVACETYLHDHTAWFAHGRGAELCTAIATMPESGG